MSRLLTGWKEIEAFCGLTYKTIRKYVKQSGFPLRYWPNTGKPYVDPDELKKWLENNS